MSDQTSHSFTPDAIPRKTHAGAHAVAVRDSNLTPQLRRLLLLTDGIRSAFTLCQLMPDLSVPHALDILAARGLLEDSKLAKAKAGNAAAQQSASDMPEGWMTASAFMMSRARENLGVAAIDVIDRIEQAHSTDEAREAMSTWYRALRGSRNSRTQADADRLKVVQLMGRV